MKKLLLMLVMFSASLQLRAEPLKFLGIDISMSSSDMTSILEKKGFKCFTKKDNEINLSCFWTLQTPETPSLSNIGWVGDIRRKEDEFVMFTCESYNGCNYPFSDLAQELAKKYRQRYSADGLVGPDGDRLVIYELSGTSWILLEKWKMKKLDF